MCGAAGGALGESVSQALDTDSHFNWTEVGVATLAGGVGGWLSGRLAPAINRGWLALANRNPGGLSAQNLLPWATTGRLGSLLHENTRIGAELDALFGLIKGIGSRLKYNGPNDQVC
jgi:hypothetical protein